MIAEYVVLAVAALTVGFFIGAVGVGGILLVATGMLLLMQAL